MQLAMASLATCHRTGLVADARRGAKQQRPAAATRSRASLVVRASTESKNLFNTSVSLGPKAPGQGGSSSSLGSPSASSKPQITLDDVPLASGVSEIWTASLSSMACSRPLHGIPASCMHRPTNRLPQTATNQLACGSPEPPSRFQSISDLANHTRCRMLCASVALTPAPPHTLLPLPRPLPSLLQVDVDYSKLRDLLKEGKWREAEDETRELLIQAAGPAAVRRGWVYFSEVKFIPGGCLAGWLAGAALLSSVCGFVHASCTGCRQRHAKGRNTALLGLFQHAWVQHVRLGPY
jgi:hypothetical protein